MSRTLLVEDDFWFRRSVCETLHAAFPDMSFMEAGGRPGALRALKSAVPDLILMDIHLPDGNGLEMTGEIHALHPNLAIVILTNFDLPEYRDAAKRRGARDYVWKGDSPAVLLDVVGGLLDGRGVA